VKNKFRQAYRALKPGEDLDLSEHKPTDRADVTVDKTVVQEIGIGVSKKDGLKCGVFSTAPTGSAAAIAGAMLQTSIACGIGAAGIAGICIAAGAPYWVTIALAAIVYAVFIAVVIVLTKNRG
jgi:hypothetical protein